MKLDPQKPFLRQSAHVIKSDGRKSETNNRSKSVFRTRKRLISQNDGSWKLNKIKSVSKNQKEEHMDSTNINPCEQQTDDESEPRQVLKRRIRPVCYR